MSDHRSPAEILAAADTEVQEADAELERLEQRVIADDPDVSPEEIEQARGRRYFAGLRRKAAERKAAALREQQLAAEREQALADAAAILAEHDDTAVDAALKAAGKAMLKLREAVRARNDARQRALRRLQASPVEPCNPAVGHTRGEPLPTYPELGHGRVYSGGEILWVGRKAYAHLDENAVMGKALQYPAHLDREAAEAERQEGAVRLLDTDKALYAKDRAAFEQLPALRRKRVFDALGLDWDAHVQARG